MGRVPILRIDPAQKRVRQHQRPLNAHAAAALPQLVHGGVQTLPLVPLPVILKQGHLEAGVHFHHPRSPDANAVDGLFQRQFRRNRS